MLQAGQRTNLLEIFNQEYARAQEEARAASGPETSVADQKSMIESCHLRIARKARDVLDAAQLAQFQAADNGLVTAKTGRANRPGTAPRRFIIG